MDLTRIFASNSPPDPGEIVALNNSIGDLTSSISQMEAQLQVMKDELKRHRSALSAFRRIPQEILGAIFLYACPSEGQVVRFGLVCRMWRKATLSTHRLWTTIAISNSKALELSLYDRIVVWFNRAGASPRELRRYSRRCTSKDCHLLDTDVHRLLTEGPKLDHLFLGCRGPHCFRRLLRALESASQNLESATRPWNRLRSLEIEFDDTYWTPQTRNPISPAPVQHHRVHPSTTGRSRLIPGPLNFQYDCPEYPAGAAGTTVTFRDWL